MSRMRILYLYPEAAEALAPLFPEFRTSVAVPTKLSHFWQVVYEDTGEEETNLGIWIPRQQSIFFSTDQQEHVVQGRALIPWRYIATIFEFELSEHRSPHHVIGFQVPQAVPMDSSG